MTHVERVRDILADNPKLKRAELIELCTILAEYADKWKQHAAQNEDYFNQMKVQADRSADQCVRAQDLCHDLLAQLGIAVPQPDPTPMVH